MDRGVANNSKNYYYQQQQRYHHHAASAAAYAPPPPHMLFAYPPGPAAAHSRTPAAHQHYQPYPAAGPGQDTPWNRLERANFAQHQHQHPDGAPVHTGGRFTGPDNINNIKKFCFRCALRGHVTRECRQFKTKPCKYFESPAGCKFTGAETSRCFFAHGPADLRNRDDVYCVRIVYDDGVQMVFGCGASGHSVDACSNAAAAAAATAKTPAPPAVTAAAPTTNDDDEQNNENAILATETIERVLVE